MLHSNENHPQASRNENSFSESPPPIAANGSPGGVAGKTGFPVWRYLFVVLVVGLLVLLMLPISSRARRPAYELQSVNNTKQIALAMLLYQNEHGSFPPAYLLDEEGSPHVSWRVFVLPYLEQQKLYEDYRREHRWDAPENRRVTATPPMTYLSPLEPTRHSKEKRTLTNYIVVTGNATMFPGSEGVAPQEISDGTGNTIMVLEILNSDIPWKEPRDLTVDEILERVRQGRNFQGPNRLGDTVIIGLADGSVHRVPIEKSDAETFSKFLTRDGGESIDFRRAVEK